MHSLGRPNNSGRRWSPETVMPVAGSVRTGDKRERWNLLGWVDCASQDDGTSKSRPSSCGARVARQLNVPGPPPLQRLEREHMSRAPPL